MIIKKETLLKLMLKLNYILSMPFSKTATADTKNLGPHKLIN